MKRSSNFDLFVLQNGEIILDRLFFGENFLYEVIISCYIGRWFFLLWNNLTIETKYYITCNCNNSVTQKKSREEKDTLTMIKWIDGIVFRKFWLEREEQR